MARAKAKRAEPIGPMQRLYNAEKVANDQAKIDVITPEQRASGDYVGDGRRIVAVHDPIERWKRSGKLEAQHVAVIEKVQRLWRITEDRRFEKLSANYGPVVAGGTGAREIAIMTVMEAEEDLARIKGYFRFPADAYFTIFENVCRFGDVGGIAGATSREAATRALTIVKFVADVIGSHGA